MVSKYLNIDCSVLMGANIAMDIGREQLSEAVIGYSNYDHAKILRKLFETPYFVVNLLPDVVRGDGIELLDTVGSSCMCGAWYLVLITWPWGALWSTCCQM
jgi:glycerol-3-phosphate dehydrogenase (NAD+)